MEATINNKELATDLLTLAVMCANEETDNCDITLTTSKGKINCHIEFEEVEEYGGDSNKSDAGIDGSIYVVDSLC